MQAELGQHSLVLQRIDGAMALACSNPLKEGQIIAPLSALCFDQLSALTTFLSAGGNEVLGDRIVK
eukprot:1505411-Lingulodinium_polyedra.AAC.1